MTNPVAPRAVALLLAGALLGALVACSDDEPGPAPGTRSPSPTSTGGSATTEPTPTPAPTRPDGDPIAFDTVGATTFPEVDVRDVALTDDVALTMTSQTVTGRALPGLATAYTVDAPGGRFTDLRVDADAGTALAVTADTTPGTGTKVGTDTFTVSEFAVADGAAGRATSVDVEQDPLAGSAGATARIVGVSGQYVVLDTFSAAVLPGDVLGEATTRHTTVVIDLDQGELAWSSRPTTPLAVAGDAVVVKTGTARRGGQVRSFALADGTTQWAALNGTKSARLVGVGQDQVVLTRLTTADDEASVIGLSLADGTVTGQRPTFSWIWTCFDAPAPLALCNVVGRPVLVAWDLDAGEPRWRLPDRRRFAPTLSTVTRDRAYGILGQAGVVLDTATGKEVAADTGAAPSQVSVWGGLSILGGVAIFQPARV